jgi:hypothetical protein
VKRYSLALLALFLALHIAAPHSLKAATSCSAQINTKTGAVQVSASGVATNPLWGVTSTSATQTFFDQNTCFSQSGGTLKKCSLQDPQTQAGVIPPPGCFVCIVDDGPNDCCSFIKGCVPTQACVGGSSGAQKKKFYLSKTLVQGNQALTACASGYHMASRLEIRQVSNFTYDTTLGILTADSGQGPPTGGIAIGVACNPPAPPPLICQVNAAGWLRTGFDSSGNPFVNGADGSRTNCFTWTSNSASNTGNYAQLLSEGHCPNCSESSIRNGPLWIETGAVCSAFFPVWCVED